MALLRIPVSNEPESSQLTELEGVEYQLRFKWHQRASVWHMDLLDVDDNPIQMGIRLVIGFPLLRRVTHDSRPPGELYALDLTDSGVEATLDDFGTRVGLFYRESE